MVKNNHLYMSRRFLYYIGLFVLLVFALVVYVKQSNSTLSIDLSQLPLEDTASVVRIHLSNHKEKVVLVKQPTSMYWQLNGQYNASPAMVNTLLKTLQYMSVKNPVSLAEKPHVLLRMESFGTRVEVWKIAYRIAIGHWRWFPYERKIRDIYVGNDTSDNLGTYMMLTEAKEPFVSYIPGFRGFLSTRFSSRAMDWRDQTVFNVAIKDIIGIDFQSNESPETSFSIEVGASSFYIKDSHKQEINIDTMHLVTYLSSFVNIKYELLLTDFSGKDSVMASTPFCVLKVKDKQGKVIEIKAFRKGMPDGLWDKDKFYAVINGGVDFVLMQYFVFDPLFKTVDYFRASP